MKSQKEILVGMLNSLCEKIIHSEKILTDLDSAIGDGDCGFGLKMGFEKVKEALPEIENESMGDILKKTGMIITANIGGTSGAIFGTGFMRLGISIGNKEKVTYKDVHKALESALEGMKLRGEDTKVGDKTLVDSLQPAVEEFGNASSMGKNVLEVMDLVVAAAKAGSDSTIPLIARKGRASYLGERSIGHRDAGSMAIYLMFESINNYLKESIYEENY